MTSFEVWRRLLKQQTVRPRPPRSSGWVLAVGKKLLLLLGLLLAIGGGAGATGYLLYEGLIRSDFFQITGIKIEGCRRTTKELILELSGVDIHTSLLGLDVEQLQSRIAGHEWIDQVKVERHWPNQLTISIRERAPVVLINLASGLHLMDRKGIVFAAAQPLAELDLPVITGVEQQQAATEEQRQAVNEAIELIGFADRGRNPALPQQNISELHLGDEGELTLYLVNRPFPIRLGKGEIAAKYQRLAKTLDWLYRTGGFSETAYIRLDYWTDQVLVGMAEAG